MPKPDIALHAIQSLNEQCVGNPYRSITHLSQNNSFIEEARQKISSFLGIKNYKKLSFTFNATHSINIVIQGALKKGDHVIFSCIEHNAVIRTIRYLADKGEIQYSTINSKDDGKFNLDDITAAIQKNTKLIVWNHASNVTGTISPIHDIAKIAQQNNILLLVDCAQTAGILDVGVVSKNADFTAYTCHKSLLSFPGLGLLYVKNEKTLKPLLHGGGGFNSGFPIHPSTSPLKFEAGTLNYFAIAALNKTTEYLSQERQNLFIHHTELNQLLRKELRNIDEVQLYGTDNNTVPITSFNIKGVESQFVSSSLYQNHKIVTRPGLHCAPLIHKVIGTNPVGCVRVSIGYKNTEKEIETLIKSIKEIIRKIV
ncbi:aminotransferase class V-fold PLP-dependent enzyme [Candidatus Sneabacter namystus]|uniref:Cysteine desulfurase n=2 Tax=Candidatus Sneabacter namystus TaxID=2601646 RepID=A0A5C0UHL5_9RICK|nr:aminotransferase class V-fold PLP-dependent enzyme [Candidatus Sneabacter namystus]